jgi:hypothetical protein
MNPRARRYVLLMLGLAGVLAGGLGLLNYTVDPYNRFGHNRLGVYISAERESKATEVCRYPHNALLLGNSRMAMIPVTHLNGFRFFNGALGGATAEETYYFAYHYATAQDLVVLGVDLGAGDPPSLQGDIFLPPSWTANLNNVLNLSTLEYSFRTISEHAAGHPPSLGADGSFYAARWFELYDREDRAQRAWQLERLQHELENYAGTSVERMSFYVKLADCLRQRGIPCVVLVPPLHEDLAKSVRGSSASAGFKAWRRRLDSIFPTVVDLSFSSYGAAENFFKCDSAHLKPDAGVQLLNAEVIPVALRMLQAKTNRLADVTR